MTEPVGGKVKHFWVHERLRPGLLFNTVLIKLEKKSNPGLKIPKLPLSLAEHDHLPLGKSAVVMVMLYATSVFDPWLRAFTIIPDFNIFFMFLPKTSTVRCADNSCLCSLWIFTHAAGNIWSEGFRMFLGAYDWRTCRCSWLFKVVKMWHELRCERGPLKLFFLWSTCYLWGFSCLILVFGCGVVQMLWSALLVCPSPTVACTDLVKGHTDQIICYTVNWMW